MAYHEKIQRGKWKSHSRRGGGEGGYRVHSIAKISMTSPIVINRLTRELLAGETKNSFV